MWVTMPCPVVSEESESAGTITSETLFLTLPLQQDWVQPKRAVSSCLMMIVECADEMCEPRWAGQVACSSREPAMLGTLEVPLGP